VAGRIEARLRRLEGRLRARGCPFCRGRESPFVFLKEGEDEPPPLPCRACGEVPRQVTIRAILVRTREEALDWQGRTRGAEEDGAA
jgi:hypothetical protein